MWLFSLFGVKNFFYFRKAYNPLYSVILVWPKWGSLQLKNWLNFTLTYKHAGFFAFGTHFLAHYAFSSLVGAHLSRSFTGCSALYWELQGVHHRFCFRCGCLGHPGDLYWLCQSIRSLLQDGWHDRRWQQLDGHFNYIADRRFAYRTLYTPGYPVSADAQTEAKCQVLLINELH